MTDTPERKEGPDIVLIGLIALFGVVGAFIFVVSLLGGGFN